MGRISMRPPQPEKNRRGDVAGGRGWEAIVILPEVKYNDRHRVGMVWKFEESDMGAIT